MPVRCSPGRRDIETIALIKHANSARQSTVNSSGATHVYLRAETSALHALAQRHMGIPTVANREAYVRYLLLNRVCGSIENGPVQAGVHRFLPDWDQRERASALADDLADLGVRPTDRPDWPIGVDAGTIVSWSYVLEGSRLGARVILRIVEANDEPQVRRATSSCAMAKGRGYGAASKPRSPG